KRETAGLEHNPPEIAEALLLPNRAQVVDRRMKVIAKRAADAAIAEQRERQVAAARCHDRAVDIDLAGLVDDDAGVGAVGERQEVRQQRGLAAAEAPGQQDEFARRPAAHARPHHAVLRRAATIASTSCRSSAGSKTEPSLMTRERLRRHWTEAVASSR